MLGDCYGPAFFREIKNSKIRSALTRIAEETQEDLGYYESVLKDFGCQVLRPELDQNDSLLNYINEHGASQGVPRSPLQPRDCQLVVGNNIFYTGTDHPSIERCLNQYSEQCVTIQSPLNQYQFRGYKGENAPNWPEYDEYLEKFFSGKPFSYNEDVNRELEQIQVNEAGCTYFPIAAPSITVVGKDIYFDKVVDNTSDPRNRYLEKYIKQFNKLFPKFRCNVLNVGGHNDGSFHTLKPGVILSLKEIQNYNQTFPDWDVCYLPNQSWEKVSEFLKIKQKVNGKWWLPGEEDNDEFTYFVETWLQNWVGYVEETVFDVNVLVLDEHYVCVSTLNPTVLNFLKKHNMEAIHVPWRHRYFWDGGLHCITLDLYREGNQFDYFPERQQSIIDIGYN